MRIRSVVVIALALVVAATAQAQDKFDPAARAKVVAPFIDEQTVAVLHADTSRMPVDALFAKALGILPGLEFELGKPRKDFEQWLKALEPVAGKDIYVVVSTADVGGSWYWYAPRITLVSLKPEADEKAVAKLFDEPDVAKKRVGNFLLIAPESTAKRLAGLKPEPHPEIAAAFEAAGDTGGQVLLFVPAYARRVIEEMMPELPREIGGGSSALLTRGVRWVAVGADVSPQLSARLVVQSQDAAAAQAFRDRWVELLKLAGQQKDVRQFVPQFDLLAAFLIPKLEGSRMSITVDADVVGKVMHFLEGPIAAAREESARQESMRNLHQIGLALLNYEHMHKGFPPAASFTPDGKPLLSWRVLILPQLDQRQLYEQFHLNESWDSPHNRTLIAKIPDVYRSPHSKLKDPGKTNDVLPIGPGTVFGGKEPMTFPDIKDGTANTILAVEVDDEHAVVWTKPDDLPYNPKEPLNGFRGMKNGFAALFCDASVHFLALTIDPNTLRALFTAAGGERVSPP